MNKLISVELKSIFNKFDIKCTILLFTLLGFVTGIINKGQSSLPCEGIFEWVMVLTLLISALGGLYISGDYTQNTIRNKIIVGHTRFSIYFSKQVAMASMYLVFNILFMGASIISNLIFVGKNDLNVKALLIGILVSLFVAVVCSAITTFISMSIKKEMGGLMPLLVMFIMLLFSGWLPEFVKGKVMDIISDIVPTSQMMLLNVSTIDPHPVRQILCSIILTIIFFSSGYFIFKKSDLN